MTILKQSFDPAEITLADLINRYGQSLKSGKLKGMDAPEFKPFMNRPAIEFFESAREPNNPLQQYFDNAAKRGVQEGSLNTTYSAVKNLEKNVKHQLKLLQRMSEYADDTNGFPSLLDTVVKPVKGPPRSKKIKINVSKYGELKVKLLEWAKNNEKDEPVVRAILTQMYTGFRPKEIMGMPMSGTIRSADEGSASKGLFLPAELAKMDEAVAVPLTPHVEGTLNAAIEHNKTRFVDKQMPDLMFLTDDGKKIPNGAMSRILSQIEVPGILEDARTGEKINFLTSAYDLRRGHATYVNMLGYPLQTGAEMKARAIKDVGAGEEATYVARPFGFYTPQQLSPHIALHNAIDNQAAAYMGVEGAKTDKNILLNPNQDSISTYKGLNRSADFPVIATTEIANVPSVDLPQNLDVPLPSTGTDEVDVQLKNSKFKNAFNKIDFTKLGLAVGAGGVALLDPVETAVAGLTRSSGAGFTASLTVEPSDTSLDLPEQVSQVYGIPKQEAYAMSDVRLQQMLDRQTKQQRQAAEQQAVVAGMAPTTPVTQFEEKRFEDIRSRTMDLQNALESNRKFDNGQLSPLP